MKLPLEWLHVYCAPDLDAEALAERLAMTGTEVGGVLHHATRAFPPVQSGGERRAA